MEENLSAKERIYWLGFSAFPGIGPLRFKLLFEYYGSAKTAWSASKSELVKIGLGDALSEKFDRFRRKFNLKGYARYARNLGVEIVTLKDEKYPQLLKEIVDAPFLLYVKGIRSQELGIRQKWNITKSIAVVGTRKKTPYGKQVTCKLVQELVAEGFTIVSGLALGIDAEAHKTTIEAGGKTIAVLGCGVDCCFPRSNQWLYDKIVDDYGVIISEYPLSQRAAKGHFPARNRIISGLSLGVVVTEGASNSGSLITARYAAEQGREVFAVPGPVTSVYSKAGNKLLKSGAKLVESADDVLEELELERQSKSRTILRAEGNTPDEKELLSLIAEKPLHQDEITRSLGWSPSKVASILSVLEIKGVVEGDGNVYALKY